MKALRTVKDKFSMDIRALVENLKALREILSSIEITNKVGDFELSVGRFQALLEDLIVVSEYQTDSDIETLKEKLVQLKIIVEELDNFCGHQLDVLAFLDDINPIVS